jgi:hypothetical protein
VKILTSIAALLFASGIGAQTFNGILIDLDCRGHDPHNRCAATSLSTHFGLETPDGQLLQLDTSAANLQSVFQGQNGDISATVFGRLRAGNALEVESIAGSGLAPSPAVLSSQPTPTPQPIATPTPEQPEAKLAGSSIRMPDGKVYHIAFAEGVSIHDERKLQTKEHVPRMTFTGAVRGDTILVDSVTLR